jgi:hypothetical protein
MAQTITPEMQAARDKLLATGKYETYTNAAGGTNLRLKTAFQTNPVVAPTSTPAATPAVTSTATTANIGLRSSAEALGLNVDWSAETGPTINGTPVSTTGLQMTGNRWYGTQQQIDQLLSPYKQAAPVYQSQLTDETQKAFADYQAWASQPYVSEYAPQMESLISQIMTRQFNYDPATDTQAQLAIKEMTRNVLETMNSRGILNSTITENQVQQGAADLLPQYQQIAKTAFQDEGELLMSQVDMLMGVDETQYGRYQDEGKRYADVLGVVMDMDETQYQRWTDAYERRYQTQQDEIATATATAEAERQKTKDMYEKWSNDGYANNEVALYFGVDPGTLSKEAREAKVKREQEIEDKAISLKNQKTMADYQHSLSKKLAEQKETLKEDATDPKSMGTAEQVSRYYDYLTAFTGGGGGTISQKVAADPSVAPTLLMQNKKIIAGKIGNKLYEQLVSDINSMLGTQKSYGSLGEPTQSQYTTIVNKAYSMKNPTSENVEPASDETVVNYIINSGLTEPQQAQAIDALGIADALDIDLKKLDSEATK